jgi:uncharacterized protein DUF2750
MLSTKEIEAVLRLPGPDRYSHFIKHIADTGEAWGLWDDGWAMGKDDCGRPTFPIWPAREYATLCADGAWSSYEPTEIPVEDLIHELLPKLQEDGIQPSVFRTPDGDAAMPSVPQILADLENEMSRYE